MTELKRTLGPLSVWGMGVGYVISGMYFGWNLGLVQSGTYGMLAATLLISLMYLCFVLSYAELATAIPRAGGVFVYAERAFGNYAGFIAGVAQCIEFIFAPPAIAAAIGAYLNLLYPTVSATSFAIAAYFIFTALNIWGVKESALFGVFVTVLAVVELLLFAGLTLPHFSFAKFSTDALPQGWWGIFPAIPFAIWFYLAIEGVANMAEEVKNPARDLKLGFILAMTTLIVLALIVFFGAIGVSGWKSVVASDSPLPLALSSITGKGHPMYHLLVSIGLLGLVASFHGILFVAGRSTMEMGRARYIHGVFAKLSHTRQTPVAALAINMLLGLGILLSGKTGDMITVAALGALTLYVFAILALFRLRDRQPNLPRPYRTPLYPVLPAIALLISGLSVVSVVYFNLGLALIYFAILVAASIYYSFLAHGRQHRL